MSLRNYVYPQNGPMPLKVRFAKSISKVRGCWVWQGQQYPNGYGLITVKGKTKLPHRVSYEVFKGPIPRGLEIDHLCRNRMCVNPDHLEAVTRQENQLRSNSVSGINARKTHCKNGHEFTEKNTYHRPDRPHHRMCRKCSNAASLAWRERRILCPS